MGWHQSRSDPRKVYNERHEVACIAASPELAAFIVRAANMAHAAGVAAPLRLTEQVVHAPKVVHPDGLQFSALTDMVDEDECCGPKLAHALRAVKATGDSWECPKCGTQWSAQERTGGVRYWSPVISIGILPAHAIR